jgi:hypothetical protein
MLSAMQFKHNQEICLSIFHIMYTCLRAALTPKKCRKLIIKMEKLHIQHGGIMMTSMNTFG